MPRLIELGMFFLLLGIILLFIGSFFKAQNNKSSIKAAGGIFIGPFPIVGFFSDKRMFYLLLVIAVILFILYMLFFRRL